MKLLLILVGAMLLSGCNEDPKVTQSHQGTTHLICTSLNPNLGSDDYYVKDIRYNDGKLTFFAVDYNKYLTLFNTPCIGAGEL